MEMSMERDEEAMLRINGYDDCIMGMACIWRDQTRVEVLVYDGDAMVEELIKNSGLTFEEAHEYVEYNIEGAYVGERTPVIVWPYDL